MQRSISTGLKETEASHDKEDFKYNVDTKMQELKQRDGTLLSATLMNWMCENMRPNTPRLTLFIDCVAYLFETNSLNSKDFIQGLVSRGVTRVDSSRASSSSTTWTLPTSS